MGSYINKKVSSIQNLKKYHVHQTSTKKIPLINTENKFSLPPSLSLSLFQNKRRELANIEPSSAYLLASCIVPHNDTCLIKINCKRNYTILKLGIIFVTLNLPLITKYCVFLCVSQDFETQKFTPKIDLDLYTGNNFQVLNTAFLT